MGDFSWQVTLSERLSRKEATKSLVLDSPSFWFSYLIIKSTRTENISSMFFPDLALDSM